MKTFLLAFTFLFLSSALYSQSFSIKVEDPSWGKESSNSVDIRIMMVITNTGTSYDWCEDLKGIYLTCDPPYTIEDIEFVNYDENITRYLKPGQLTTGYITFRVPKDADNLYLKFTEQYGGASKFISRSYNTVKEELNKKQYAEVINEAENAARIQNYELAIAKYKSAVFLAPEMKDFLNTKISEHYVDLGNKYYFTAELEESIKNFKFALELDPNNLKAKQKISQIYEKMGDSYMKNSDYIDAKRMFDSALVYEDNEMIVNKMKDLRKREENMRNKNIEAERRNKKQIEFENIYNPALGLNLNATFGLASTNVGTIELPVVGANMKLPYKFFADESSKLCLFMNNNLGYSGVLLKSQSDFSNFTGFDYSKYKINRNPAFISELFYYTGLGVAILNKYFEPMISINYGINFQVIIDGVFENRATSSSVKSPSAFGHGLVFDAQFKIGKSSGFSFGYTYKMITYDGRYEYNSYKSNSHNLTIGFAKF